MTTTYTVVPGDNLSRIAQRHGLRSWRQIYDDPANAAFRRRRPNPNLIYPGDVLTIPGGTPSPGTPPTAPTAPAATQSRLERDIEAWLTANRNRNHIDHLATQSSLILLAETHVGRTQKAAMLAQVINLQATRGGTRARFHASEHFINDAPTQVAIQNFVWSDVRPGNRLRMRLPVLVQRFEPVLEATRTFPRHRYAIICAGSPEQDGDPRHAAIHLAFNSSMRRHNTLHSLSQFDLRSAGNFLLGAFHAARRHTTGGSTPTTCMRLLDDGWRVQVIRLTVNETGSSSVSGSTISIVPGEGFELAELGSSTSRFDMVPILNRVAAGSPFLADITGARSPFGQVQSADEAAIPYNELYDAILHLP